MTTPTCPSCGAKFSHDGDKLECKKCGLPDEILDMGPQVVARWKRKTIGKRRVLDKKEKHTVAQKRQKKVITVPAADRRRNKHGRKGVKA